MGFDLVSMSDEVETATPVVLRRTASSLEREITSDAHPGLVATLLHSVYDQPDAASVHAQFDRVLDAPTGKLPTVAEHLDAARADVLAFTAFPRRSGGRSGRTTPPSGSTGRSAGAPTSSGSSPTGTPPSAWSAPSWPSNTTNGPKAAGTSASTS